MFRRICWLTDQGEAYEWMPRPDLYRCGNQLKSSKVNL